MNTEIANAVNAAGDKAQYDTRVKRLLAQKSILAHILVKTIDEFKGMKPEDVVKYIEGEPSISVVPVEPGLANMEKTDATGQRIVGLNTENAEINEGLVRFDIIFYVRMKNGLSQIIVNIEAQKDEPTEYKILNRAIFYVSRLISSQKERDFVNTNYDDIKQVFSIWICMNMDDNSLSHIHLTKDELLKPCNWKGNLDLLNIVLIGITNGIPEHDEKYEMHRLIGALLSSELKEQEKTLVYLDSLLQKKQSELDAIKGKFTLEKDAEYQKIGNYLHPSQVIEKNLHRSYLRFQVNETGQMSMTSIYCGPSNIHHISVKVIAPDGSFAETPASKDSYETTDLGEKIEKADYKIGEDGNVIGFLYLNKDKNIKVNYQGERPYSTTMTPADRQAVASIYELAQLLSSITEIKKEMEEANLKIEFVKRKMQEREEKETEQGK